MVGVSRGLLLSGLIVALAALGMVCVGISGGVRAAEMHPEPGVVYRLAGDMAADTFGTDIEPLDDLDGDGVPEFAVGAGEVSRDGTDGGYVRIFSGRDGAVIHTLEGWISEQGFGEKLTSMRDVNGDGKRELVVVHGEGTSIYDPKTAEELYRIDVGPYPEFAGASDAGDLDGDGRGDLFLGEPSFSSVGQLTANEGRVWAYSVAKDEVLWLRVGEFHATLGEELYTLGDSTGDGVPELLAHENVQSVYSQVAVLDGSSGETIGTVSERRLDAFTRVISVLGDLNDDGVCEFAISGQHLQDSLKEGVGIVLIYDGRTFELFRRHEGVDGRLFGFAGDLLGSSIGNAGDMDGDGVSDYLLADQRRAGGLLFANIYLLGKIYLRSGRTGRPLATYMGRKDTNSFLTGALSALGDVDGDGGPEFLLGSPRNGFADVDRLFTHGEVRVLTFDSSWPSFIRGDANGDGKVDLTDAFHIALFLLSGDSAGCVRALDVNATGQVALADALLLLRHIFLGDVAPAAPFPQCSRLGGFLEDELPCEQSLCTP